EDLKEFLFVKNFYDKGSKKNILIYFPSNSTIRKTHPFYWIDMMDAVIYLLTRKAEKIIIASPFPSFPQLENKVYRDKLKNLCEKRNVEFFDIFEIFTEIENGEKFFKKNNIYTEFPDTQGISLLADKIPF
ncbi:hypothetical protein J7L87_01210, partial [bacterium]|nr:hypothetical protein [bacterium]